MCTQRDLEEDGTLCSRPIEIIPGKFFGRLSLAGQFNSYHPFYGTCLDEGFPTRSTGPDLTFALAVREGARVRARMRSNVMPVTLALSTACGDDDPIDYVLNEACVAIAQTDVLGAWAEVTWTSDREGLVYLVTGTPRTTASGLFDLEVTFDE